MTSDELQLQAALQRFTTEFSDRIAQATEALEQAGSPRVRDNALRKTLLYISSAMEIATGTSAAINLLDMFVFIRLCRAVLERHWMPSYGQAGDGLHEAFAQSDHEITSLAHRELGAVDAARLEKVVATWLADNPTQTRIEGVRLSTFAEAAGTAASGRVLEARGLLSSVKTATQAANEALLLVERGLFLVHRLPFVWRLQARLGAREVFEDSVLRLEEGVRDPISRFRHSARQLASQVVVYAGLLGGTALIAAWMCGRRARR